MPSARSRSVVGQMQHVEWLDCSSAMSCSSTCVACTAVNRSPSTPCRSSKSIGVQPCTAQHCSFSAGCSLTWACSGASCAAAHSATTDIDAGSTLRTEWIAAPIFASVPSARSVDPRRPRVGVAVAEPLLRAVEHCIAGHARPQVARVEQRDANACRRCCLEQHLAHLVRLRIRRAAAIVVQVVELADAGEPGQHHLGERRRGQVAVRVGVEPVGKRVHPIAPRPERAGLAMRAAAQRPMERVAVRVGHSRQRQPGEPVGIRSAAITPTDTSVIRSPSTVIDDAPLDLAGEVTEPRQFAPVRRHDPRRHDPTRATNSVIRSTNAARWNRSNCSHVVKVVGSTTRSRNSTPSR